MVLKKALHLVEGDTVTLPVGDSATAPFIVRGQRKMVRRPIRVSFWIEDAAGETHLLVCPANQRLPVAPPLPEPVLVLETS